MSEEAVIYQCTTCGGHCTLTKQKNRFKPEKCPMGLTQQGLSIDPVWIPDLKTCAECKLVIDEKISYRVMFGTYFHERCFQKIENAFEVS